MHSAVSDVLNTLSLAAHSVTLLFAPSAIAPRLGQTIVRKYSEPAEIEEHRRQALAGPAPRQAHLMERHVKPGASVIDIGCAAGRFCFAVAAQGHPVIGVDLTEAMVREASALARAGGTRIPFCVMNAQALGLRDQSFDAALMFGSVLSHVPLRSGRLAALREAHRVLRPGGTLLVETQSRASTSPYRAFFGMMAGARRALAAVGQRPAWEVGDRFGTRVSDAESSERVYFHMYAPPELEQDLREAGFEPQAADITMYLMHYAAVKR